MLWYATYAEIRLVKSSAACQEKAPTKRHVHGMNQDYKSTSAFVLPRTQSDETKKFRPVSLDIATVTLGLVGDFAVEGLV